MAAEYISLELIKYLSNVTPARSETEINYKVFIGRLKVVVY